LPSTRRPASAIRTATWPKSSALELSYQRESKTDKIKMNFKRKILDHIHIICIFKILLGRKIIFNKTFYEKFSQVYNLSNFVSLKKNNARRNQTYRWTQ
jgi:Leucine-rich repeat (LRR) protein